MTPAIIYLTLTFDKTSVTIKIMIILSKIEKDMWNDIAYIST